MKPFLAAHCAACHGTEEPEAKLDLESLTADMTFQATAATWAAVLRKIVTGEIPPEDEPRPAAARRTHRVAARPAPPKPQLAVA